MARFLSYTFPAGNEQDVCLTQTLAAAGKLIINGNLATPVNNTVSFLNKGYIRQISITSVNNLTGVTFTINGIQNGVSITESITGPNSTTVYSVLAYDSITSISSNGAANAVSVGTGWFGIFPLIGINMERDVINYTLTIARLTAASVPFALFGTIANIVNNGHTYMDIITNNMNLFQIRAVGIGDNYIYSTNSNATAIYSSFFITLGANATTIANSMTLNFIQT
jgi:hypothetical protein